MPEQQRLAVMERRMTMYGALRGFVLQHACDIIKMHYAEGVFAGVARVMASSRQS